MTLGDFFSAVSNQPGLLIFFFIAIPLLTFLTNMWSKGEGDQTPWSYLYAAIIYSICIPGILAFTLNIYLFLFERSSIWDTSLYLQILPIISMAVTLWLVKRNVCFEDIPAFGKLSGLLMIMFTLLSFMWVLEKTHIIVFSLIPFYYVGIIFIIMLLVFVFGFKRLFN